MDSTQANARAHEVVEAWMHVALERAGETALLDAARTGVELVVAGGCAHQQSCPEGACTDEVRWWRPGALLVRRVRLCACLGEDALELSAWWEGDEEVGEAAFCQLALERAQRGEIADLDELVRVGRELRGVHWVGGALTRELCEELRSVLRELAADTLGCASVRGVSASILGLLPPPVVRACDIEALGGSASGLVVVGFAQWCGGSAVEVLAWLAGRPVARRGEVELCLLGAHELLGMHPADALSWTAVEAGLDAGGILARAEVAAALLEGRRVSGYSLDEAWCAARDALAPVRA